MGTKEVSLKNAYPLIISAEWQNFRVPDFGLIKAELSEAVWFDGRNMFEPSRMEKKGFGY